VSKQSLESLSHILPIANVLTPALRADASSISQQQDPDYIPPDFAARLHKMGIVQPNPLWSPSSIANPFPHVIPKGPSLSPSAPSPPSAGSAPAGRERVVPSPSSRNVTLGVLEARRRLEAQATEQFERRGRASVDQGDELVDVGTLKRALVMRAAGTPAAEIEARLRLKKGVVARLGGVGVVSPAS
jgi:hypothetical protein